MVDEHAAQPPLAKRYPFVVVVAVIALAPYLVLTTATPLLQKVIVADTGMSMVQNQMAEGISNAGYAFGAVLAAFLVQRYRQRVLFLGTELLFVVASGLAAGATNPGMFMSGRILQGFATGLMLVVALPPLLVRFPVDRLPSSAVWVNLGLFGAVTLGPLLGGWAQGEGWRYLFAATGVIGLANTGLAALSLERFAPFNPERAPDVPAFALAAAATALPFAGIANLQTNGFSQPVVFVPVAVGVALLVALVVYQRVRDDSLMPIKPMLPAVPVTGLFVAMVAGAVYVAAVQLVIPLVQMGQHASPGHTGLRLWPSAAGVVVSAVAFGRLVRTRWTPLLVLAGLSCLVAGCAVLAVTTSPTAVLTASGLLGIGAGATVSPALFTAAFSVDSSLVGRVFALVELLRVVAAFLVGPVLLHLAQTLLGGNGKPDLAAGFHRSMLIDLVVAAAGLVVAAGSWLSAGLRLPDPDVADWLDGGGDPAIDSPALLGLLRPLVSSPGRHAPTS